VTVRSFAKVNLGLRIGPPRVDGFHGLTTLYQTIGLFDELTVTARPASETSIVLRSNEPRVPTDGRNTVHKTVSLALAAMGVTAAVEIFLQKNLPIQGGLGAGSANAAAALLGLERELGVSLSAAERFALAEQVGSDVPLFLIGGTVYGHDRGQIVLPYPDVPAMPCVVFAPVVGSSTPLAFRAWDERIGALTPEAATRRLDELSRVYASAFAPAGQAGSGGLRPEGFETGASGVSGALDGLNETQRSGDLAGNPLPALVRTGIENDFEEVVFLQHPFLRDILHALRGEDALPAENRAVMAALSGSGSSLFALFATIADAEAAMARVQGFAGRAFLTETLTRQQYWHRLFA